MLKLFYTEVKPDAARVTPDDLHNAAHECLRQGVLSCLTGLYAQPVHAVKLSLGYGPHGKPYLTSHPALEISLSHAGHIAMCALSEQTLGVDVQDHRSMTDDRIMQLASRFYAHEERRLLSETASDEAQRNLFFRLWAAKEAYAKFTGMGLAEDFTRFYADFDDMVIRRSPDGRTLGFLQAPLELPHYSCIICTEEKASGAEVVSFSLAEIFNASGKTL